MKKMGLGLCLVLFCRPMAVDSAYVVMSNGEVIEGVDEHEIQSVASISKVMTALVAIEQCELNEVVVVDALTTQQVGSSIYLKENEQYTLLSLLFGLMMRSGNDAAYLIAIHVSGNIPAFVSLMNEKAKEIGMSDTTFQNPSGLDETDGGNLSTCYDMALLMEEAMKNAIFRIIVATKTYKSENSDIWINKNKLLYDYEYANGGKTGYTMNSGKTLITSANNGVNENIVVSFRESRFFTFHRELHEKTFQKIKTYKILSKGTYLVRGKQIVIEEDQFMVKAINDEVLLHSKIKDKQLIVSFINFQTPMTLHFDMKEVKS